MREHQAPAGNITRCDQVAAALQHGCHLIRRKRNYRAGFGERGAGWRAGFGLFWCNLEIRRDLERWRRHSRWPLYCQSVRLSGCKHRPGWRRRRLGWLHVGLGPLDVGQLGDDKGGNGFALSSPVFAGNRSIDRWDPNDVRYNQSDGGGHTDRANEPGEQSQARQAHFISWRGRHQLGSERRPKPPGQLLHAAPFVARVSHRQAKTHAGPRLRGVRGHLRCEPARTRAQGVELPRQPAPGDGAFRPGGAGRSPKAQHESVACRRRLGPGNSSLTSCRPMGCARAHGFRIFSDGISIHRSKCSRAASRRMNSLKGCSRSPIADPIVSRWTG